MRGYRRPGPLYTTYCWWGTLMLISDDEVTEEQLRAEDEAIAAEAEVADTQQANLNALAELMRDDRTPQALPEAHDSREG